MWALLTLSGCITPPTPVGPQQVTVHVDGAAIQISTLAPTVREALTEAGVRLDNLDYVKPPETTLIRSGLTIEVIRVVQETHIITQTVPYSRQTVRDSTIPVGESRLLQSGQPGVREFLYRITRENGVEMENTLVRDSLTQPPVDEVQLVGTRPRLQTVTITGTLAYLENQDAWVMRNSSNNRRRLTTLGDLDGRVFVLSPTGGQLLFTRASADPAHINELWVLNTTLADAEAASLNVQDVLWADWDPRGERIAWTTAEVVERAPGWRGQNDLWVATLSSQQRLVSQRQVLKPEAGGGYGWWGTRYTWSPDGRQLAFSQPDAVGVVTVQNGQRETLGTFPGYRTYSSWAWNPGIAWSPDGDFVVTLLHKPGPAGGDPEESPVFNLWVVEATGAYGAELAAEVGMWAAPQYSPDGETILFGRAQVPYKSDISTYGLCTLDRDGSNRECHYPPPDEPGVQLPLWRWDPTGEHLVFVQWDDIYLLRLSDGQAAPITDGGRISAFDWK